MHFVRFAVLAALLKVGCASAQVIVGVATHVEDGDTVTVSVGKDRFKIRLAGIDAPEVCHTSRDPTCAKPGQAYGDEARQALVKLVLHKQVRADCNGTSYDRTACKLYQGDVDVLAELARLGMVWMDPKFGTDPRLTSLVANAKAQRIGLWSAPNPQPPWLFRRKCWGQGQCQASATANPSGAHALPNIVTSGLIEMAKRLMKP